MGQEVVTCSILESRRQLNELQILMDNYNKPYIIPRKKKPDESRKENLTRRIEEHIEFSHACGKMSLTSFFEELKDYIYHSN